MANLFQIHPNNSYFWINIKAMRIILISAFLFICTALVQGQNDALKFKSFSITDGLSQSTIERIFEDKKGFLWFATSDGLNQFDGYKFTVYKNNHLNSNSLSDSWIHDILFEDSENNLWLITADRNLNKFNLRTREFSHFPPVFLSDKSRQPVEMIYFICEDSHKIVWLSTDKGLLRYTSRTGKFIPETKLPAKLIFKHIFEDIDGKMWFSGNNGLYRYDFKSNTYTCFLPQKGKSSGISSNQVVKVWTDGNKRLWALTNNGLNSFDRSSGSFVSYWFSSSQTIGGGLRISSAFSSQNGSIWIATNHGAFRFEPSSHQFFYYNSKQGSRGITNDEVTHLFEDKIGNIWIGTAFGLNRFNPSNGSFDHYFNKDNNRFNNYISQIIEDRNSRLWVLGWIESCKGGYLSLVDKKNKVFTPLLSNRCKPNSIPSTFIYQTFKDKSGNLWLGTYGAGIIQGIPSDKKFGLYQSQPGSTYSVWGFAEDKEGNLWIPLYDQGLDKFDPRTRRFTHIPLNSSNKQSSSILSIAAGKNGDLWLATLGDGIIKYNIYSKNRSNYRHKPGQEPTITSNMVRKVMVDYSGNLWIGTLSDGIDVLNTRTNKIERIKNEPGNNNSLADNNIWCLYEARNHDIWIACAGYIDRYNPVTRKFTHFRSKSSDSTGLIADKALCIYEDLKGNMWFGTSGGGLSRLNPKTGKFRHWTEEEGLPNNVIYGILEDESSHLWLSTNRGLSRFDIKNGTFTNFDESAGLQSNEFNMGAYLRTHDNKLYFGGINGFNSFYAKDISKDSITPHTVITGFQIANKEVPVVPVDKRNLSNPRDSFLIIRDNNAVYLPQNITYLNRLTITHHEKVFTFEYAALGFNTPEKTTYRYMMEGFDTEWNNAGRRRFATYTNLPAGEYTFKVTAANADGVWNPVPTVLKIRILPPFWRTWWFIALELLTAAAVIILVVRLREKNLKHAKAKLELKIKQRTRQIEEKNEELELRNAQILQQKEEIAIQAMQLQNELTAHNQTSEIALLRSQINPHFLFNTLNNIYSLVYQRSENAPEAVMKLSEIMRYMLYEASAEKVLLEKEINYLKSFIELQLLRIKNRDFVSFNISGDFTGRTISPMLLIAFVENAFKHGVKKGINPGIIINLDVTGNTLTFEVINYWKPGDSGNKDQTGGIGLVNIRRRLELLCPNRFDLRIEKKGDEHHVKLTITE
ncbi:MAG: two-component regulator propeller domain-containing protein [Bacteroidota bacterium]|nr:two-component regulator propeller domain-containing protein [Bacteroidota bacterium]